jgi:hypothetical protein
MNSRAYVVARAVQRPILIMTVGILFAIQQAGSIAFWRTWPLLLIELGVLKLVQRAVSGPGPFPKGGLAP